MRKQLFLSHTWAPDSLKRNNHARVGELKKELTKLGWTSWFDEDDMKINVDMSMVNGIEQCDVFLACLTKEYINSINNASRNLRQKSNVLKEWTYAHARKKIVFGILLEPIEHWPHGIVTMYIANQIYINASHKNMSLVAKEITEMLSRHWIFPCNKRRFSKWKQIRLLNLFCSNHNEVHNNRVTKVQRTSRTRKSRNAAVCTNSKSHRISTIYSI